MLFYCLEIVSRKSRQFRNIFYQPIYFILNTTKAYCMLKILSLLWDNNNKEYSKDVILTGTQYSVENTDLSSKRRRRRLLSLDGGINKVGC